MTIEQHAHVPEEVDVVVIGVGAGGLAAAAWLVKAGYRILVVEAKPQVGGRASTEPIDGFGVNTGAQIFELGGANKTLFDDVGIPIRARKQPVPLILRLGRRDVQVMSGITGFLANKIGIPVIGGLARRFGWFRPKEGIFLDTWLDQLHAPVKIKRLCRNLTSALFAAEPSDVIATLFFDYLTKKGGMNTYGAHPDGSIGPWQDLAAGIQRAGGTILLDTSVTAIGVGDDGRADTIVIRKAPLSLSAPGRPSATSAPSPRAASSPPKPGPPTTERSWKRRASPALRSRSTSLPSSRSRTSRHWCSSATQNAWPMPPT
ncbi:MAG: NAD(P)-binding protein [Microbacteriaceae bacterium]